MSCCLVIGYPHKSFGSCCDKALTFRWAIMGWPIDWLCVTLTLPLCNMFHTHGICLYLLFLAFSLEFVSLPKEKKFLLLLLLNICKLSDRIGYRCPHLESFPTRLGTWQVNGTPGISLPGPSSPNVHMLLLSSKWTTGRAFHKSWLDIFTSGTEIPTATPPSRFPFFKFILLP